MTTHDGDSLDRCKQVYAGEAEAYDRLISAEDCDGNLLPAIESVATLATKRVLDVGSGTGRLARLLQPHCGWLAASDREVAMLRVARGHLRSGLRSGSPPVAAADGRALPFRDASFDVITAGWVFGHLTFWDAKRWPAETTRAIGEIDRVLAPGGTAVLFETLGTGVTEPAPPEPPLARYYEWLERDMEFERRVLTTDFQFESVEDAAESCGFFFGPAYADRIRANGWARVPEFTGMWWRRAKT